MHSPHWSAGRWGKSGRLLTATVVVVVWFVGILWLGSGALAQFAQPQIFGGRGDPSQRGDLDSSSGVYLPTDRTLSRAVSRARERLSAQEYQEALGFLHGILSREEDSFIESGANDRGQRGLKATARRMIGELPPAGLDAYELLQGPAARRQLEAALKDGNRDAIAKVVRQFFHTSAGYEATFVLAQLEADQGHRSAAAQLFQDLIDSPRAAAMFEPQLSVAAAVNQLAAGRAGEAGATMRSLIERKPAAEVSFFGKKATLPASADALAWLTKFVGSPQGTSAVAGNWVTLRGDASRNVTSPGGKPHLRPRWEARVVNEPAIESYLIGRSNDFLQRNVVAIPAAKPIAVGDVVVMRTPNNIVAVDWQTGKRVWETRDEQDLDPDEDSAEANPGVDGDQVATEGKPLEERTWDDQLASGITSDGARVFVIRGLGVARQEDVFPWQFNPGLGRGGVEQVASTNELAAYDLATQGKLTWQLDGARATGPLAGAFFLGPPLAIDNTLFVMAEIRQALYLLALEPATGQLQWQQQLIGLEQGIMVDPARRRIGAMPSYAGGILVCPTGASAVVAIDVVKREFAWVYRYPREAQAAADARQLWQQQQLQGQLVRSNDQWVDGTAVISENRVLITPPESADVHCLDLQTGKQEWKRRKGEALFVGGVQNGVVLLVGSQAVQGVRLSDGAPAWKQESSPLPTGALPSGQGYMSDGQYFLPLTSGQIVQVDMTTGKVAGGEASPASISLGNLVCYRGSVISQSPLVLDKFEQLQILQSRTEAALAQNASDPAALRELAEIKGASGEAEEAVKLLKRAYELAPDDGLIQEMLVEHLLRQLSSDYAAYRADVPLVSKLARGREQQIELMRINAQGLAAMDDRLAAWDAYLRLADYTAEEPAYLRMGDHYVVRSDRWIGADLGSIWSDSAAPKSSDLKGQLIAKIAERKPSVSNPQTASELRHYLAHFGELPESDSVRLALAKFLADRGRNQEAEIELLQLAASQDASIQSTSRELLKNLDAKDKKTNHTRGIEWPRGRVEAKLQSVTPDPNRERARAPIDRQVPYRELRVEQTFAPGASALQWLVATDCSEIVARNSLGNDVFHLTVDQSRLSRQNRDSGLAHAASLGHLLYVSLGGQIFAIDSRKESADAEGDLLWPIGSSDDFAMQAKALRAMPASQARASRPPIYHPYSGRRRIAGTTGNGGSSLGPVSPRGVVFQDGDELKCVDPLSGAVLWARSDVPAGCEVFGDDELVFAADVGNHLAYVVRLSDGKLLEKRELPKAEWLLTSGRNLAQLVFSTTGGNRVMHIKVTDVWSQQPAYDGDFPIAARLSVMEPGSIAIFEPSGEFHVLDVSSGKMLIDTKLEPAEDLQSIQTLVSGDELYLFVSSQVQQQFKPIGLPVDFPLTNGLAYAFSLKSGEPIWPSPALLRNRGIVVQQPEDIPMLIFVERQMTRDAASGGGSQLRLLCIDKRTGQTLHRNDALPDTAVTRFRIHGEEGEPAVAVEMGTGKIQLAMTDKPRPPQPPTNDDLEAPREMVERGLKAIGQRWGNALRDALERPAGVPVPPAGLPPKQLNRPAPQNAEPAKKNVPQTDDD
jgi:outer membrane protein assembly factor BamB